MSTVSLIDKGSFIADCSRLELTRLATQVGTVKASGAPPGFLLANRHLRQPIAQSRRARHERPKSATPSDVIFRPPEVLRRECEIQSPPGCATGRRRVWTSKCHCRVDNAAPSDFYIVKSMLSPEITPVVSRHFSNRTGMVTPAGGRSCYTRFAGLQDGKAPGKSANATLIGMSRTRRTVLGGVTRCPRTGREMALRAPNSSSLSSSRSCAPRTHSTHS